MNKVKITVTSSKCRCGYCKKGDEYFVEDLCPPICHELWHTIYPMVYTLLNGGTLDFGDERVKYFNAKCPDEGRVVVHAEVIEDEENK